MGRPTLAVARVEDLGPAIRDLRKSQDVTQADVAAAMADGTTHATTVGAWENSRIIPSVRKLMEMLDTHNYIIVLMPKEFHRRHAWEVA